MDSLDTGETVINEPLTLTTSNLNVKLGATLNQGEDIPPANSPATSVSSIFSEQFETSRNSPYQVQSPLNSSVLFQRPDFNDGDRPMSYPLMSSLSTNFPDSETSSRSSSDGYNLKDSTSEKIKHFREKCKRVSNASSSEEDGDSNDSPVRKSSNKSNEEKFAGRGIDAPRGRIANIRRESSCSVDSEAAHERLLKASQVVSTGFDEIAIEQERSPSSSAEFRRRAPSFNAILGEPISVVTNAFIPSSCTPSPTRPPAELIKQCYSPSTQQIIRPNISYSPSPRPSPAQSPTRHGHKIKFQRAESPICRTPVKRKITLPCSSENPEKRSFISRSNTSPLVTDKMFPYPTFNQMFESSTSSGEFNSFSVPHSPAPLRSTTPLSSFSAGDQEETSSSVKDVEEKIADDEEMDGMEICDDYERSSSEDMKGMDDCNEQLAEQLLQAATEAALPSDDDDDFSELQS
uniref:Protein aurora borealis n=1 Tax=Caenorhabditis tropicalis TaxID=1561998 RepID=A0A1I7TWJ8_9PELO